MAPEPIAQQPLPEPADGVLAEPLDAHDKELAELLAIVADALAFSPPLYLDSIVGHPWTWLPPYPRYSEFSILDPRRVARTVKYLVEITVPAFPVRMPETLANFLPAVFWRPTRVLFEPDGDDNPYSYPDEAWIFINGVATNPSMAKINAEYLVSLFHRPITIIQNATDSVGLDLLEAVVGKAWQVMTEASAKAYPFVHHALHNPDKKRVVVLCHSQGTIIMSNVLRALLDPDHRDTLRQAARRRKHDDDFDLPDPEHLGLLEKLEIYAFANCATDMVHAPGLTSGRGRPVPWIESFGNEYDLVARCGMLAPNPDKRGIHIEGGHYVRSGQWGHLLNLHYLKGMADHLKEPERQPNPYLLQASRDGFEYPAVPRLFGYHDGKVPEPY